MSNGFSLTLTNGAVEVWAHGDAAGRRLVSTAQDGSVGVVLYGRLHYREDLTGAIGASAADVDDDAALVLASYRKFGIEGVERLEGDFALAVIDPGEGQVVASRDPMGGYPLFWKEAKGRLAIATCLRPLDALADGAAPDLGFLGEIQMMPFFEIDYLDRSAFAGIYRLVPGTTLVADMQTGTTQLRRFWDWGERIDADAGGDIDATAARFRELLERAIAQRLRGKVAAHLSGGMDSTAVALLAHQHLHTRGEPLHAVTVVYDKLFGLADEASYIAAVADRPGLVSHRFPGDDILDYDHLGAAPLYDEPHSGFFRAPMNIALVEAAVGTGAETVLTGLGADELAIDAPFHIADELRRGRLRTAWREAARWARSGSRSPWRIFFPFGLEPLTPRWLRPGFRAALRGGFASPKGSNAWTIPPWVQPDFARNGELRERVLGHWRRMTRSAANMGLSHALAAIECTSGDWVRATFAAPRGLHVSHPFRDPRLIAEALGARLRLRPIPGEQKALLGRATRDVLPEAIVNRRDKGNFNAVYFQGVARNLPKLERLVEASEAQTMGLFDTVHLTEALHRTALGIDNVENIHGLNNSVAILHWLSQLPAWRAAADPALPLFSAASGEGIRPAAPSSGASASETAAR